MSSIIVTRIYRTKNARRGACYLIDGRKCASFIPYAWAKLGLDVLAARLAERLGLTIDAPADELEPIWAEILVRLEMTTRASLIEARGDIETCDNLTLQSIWTDALGAHRRMPAHTDTERHIHCAIKAIDKALRAAA